MRVQHTKLLTNLDEKRLLSLYSDLMEELRERGVIRSSNNPVADYGEYIVARKLGLKLQTGSNKGFDAQDKKGLRYQIKSRRITPHNKSLQLGVIRNLKDKPFDFLIAIIFNSDFSMNEVYKIPFKVIKKYSRFSKHQNGNILILRGKILADHKVLKYKV